MSNILFSDDFHRFGEVEYIGSPIGGLQLDVANALLAPNRTDAEKLARLDLLVDAVKHHLIPTYEDALQPDADAKALVGGLLANLNVSQASDLWAWPISLGRLSLVRRGWEDGRVAAPRPPNGIKVCTGSNSVVERSPVKVRFPILQGS